MVYKKDPVTLGKFQKLCITTLSTHMGVSEYVGFEGV